MTVSPYFKQSTSVAEQNLFDSLTREMLSLKGYDMQYIPRSYENNDYLYGETIQEGFQEGVVIEMMLDEVRGFPDNSDIMTKFGLEVRDEATFWVSKSRFTEVVTVAYPEITSPREGDLIFFHFSHDGAPSTPSVLFEIHFVENEKPFYPRGIQTMWQFTTRKFEYNHDKMETNDEYIDSLNVEPDINDDKPEIQSESDTFVDFSEKDPFAQNF